MDFITNAYVIDIRANSNKVYITLKTSFWYKFFMIIYTLEIDKLLVSVSDD